MIYVGRLRDNKYTSCRDIIGFLLATMNEDLSEIDRLRAENEFFLLQIRLINVGLQRLKKEVTIEHEVTEKILQRIREMGLLEQKQHDISHESY